MKFIKNSTTALIVLAMTSSTVFAAGAPVQNQFVGGQPASASQVNQNFQELADRIADIPLSAPTPVIVYDYNNYKTTATSKTFSRSKGNCATPVVSQVHDYLRTVNGTTTDVEVTETLNDSNGVCQKKVRTYTETATAKNFVSQTNFLLPGGETHFEILVENPEILNSTMRRNIPITSTSPASWTYFDANGSPIETRDGRVFIQMTTVLGVEDVTVPAGSYSNCLKIHINRTNASTGNFTRISWLCPGVGEVKRVHHETNGGSHILELESITPTP